MSQLIQMRQRIKAVETIKKITHAMRLISMSSHTRFRTRKQTLTSYKNDITALFNHVQPLFPQWTHEKITGTPETKGIPLVILVGSQKGLCGTFNASLFSFFEREYTKDAHEDAHIISVGKKAGDYIKKRHGSVIMRFSEFTSLTLPGIVNHIIDHLLAPTSTYTSTIIYSNYIKTFFVQRPRAAQLIPFTLPKEQEKTVDAKKEYVWEQDPYDILTTLANTLLRIKLQDILLESLTAEQAARFVAMDNSTRNATNLLDTMCLKYNKTRQAKITRELTDLASSFQENSRT